MSTQNDALDKRAVLKEALRAVKEMQAQLEAADRVRTEPIAIVGMGCRFPGGAVDPDAYWRLLARGGDAITEVPPSRWSIDDYAALDPEGARLRPIQYGGFLSDIDRFDPHFFGIAPREAAALDPQHRLVLEVCWEALENASQSPSQLRGSLTGVFIGITSSDYANHLRDADPSRLDVYSASGNVHNSAAGRVSYLLGLHGPSIAVDTACSASLTAIHLACQSLRLGESDLALAGGVNCMLTPEAFVSFTKAGMLARDGRCKSFDAAADGLVRAEGCGMIVLKRLSDAAANGDRVLALIRGSAVNQDGPSSGLTVPNGPAQQAVIRKALSVAKIKPADVQYVEAHGTGTSLGDPIELEALDAALSEGRPKGQPLIVGAVKTNLGHLEAASGVAGLMKIVLSLQHETIPANLHFKQLNPAITLRHLEVQVPTAAIPWRRDGVRRVASVSSFGFSGTNAHVVLEEAPAVAGAGRTDERPRLVALSARSASALKTLAMRWQERLSDNPASLADIARTSTTGRAHFPHRAAIVASATAELTAQLRAFAAGTASNVRVGDNSSGEVPTVAFLFTGQGSQYAGMGHALYRTQPVFRRALEECDALVRTELDRPLLDVIFAADGALINQTGYTQPALFAIEYALYEMWTAWGIHPAAVLGHSVGEYVAACAAGVFSLQDGLRLIAARGRLMQALPAGGAMAAVFADEARVRRAIAAAAPGVDVAAVNGPANTVVAGPAGAVDALCAALNREHMASQALVVSHAFHSALMEPMLNDFRRVAEGVVYSRPRLPLVSNLTGQVLAAEARVDAEYWVQHVRATVRFADGLRAVHQTGCRTFLELGPSPTLVTMGQRVLENHDARWLHSLRRGREDWQEVLTALADLYSAGADVAWPAVQEGSIASGVDLPTYPFERDRHWVDRVTDSVMTPPEADTPVAVHPLLGRRVPAAVRAAIFESRLSRSRPAFLGEHIVTGEAVFPATGFIEMALAAARQHAAAQSWRIEDLAIETPLLLSDQPIAVQTVVTADSESGASIAISSARDAAAGEWTTHATARVVFAASSIATETATLEERQARLDEDVPVETLYEQHRARGIEYGPTFRAISDVRRRDGESLGRITEVAARDGFILHPASLDACLQLLGAAVRTIDDADAMYLPVGVGEIQVVREGEIAWSHVRVTVGDDPQRDGFTADVTLLDGHGGVLTTLRGVRLRRASAEALRRTVQRTTDDWLYDSEWVELPPPTGADHPQPGTWVMVGGDAWPAAQHELVAALTATGQHIKSVPAGDDLRSLCRELPGETPALRGFIYMATVDGRTADAAGAVAAATQPLLALAHALIENERPDTTVWIVTRRAQQVSDEACEPSLAPLWSLAKTLSIEHPQIACRCVDVDELAGPALAHVTRLIATAEVESQLAVRGDRVLAARLVPSKLRAKGRQDDSVALAIPRRGVLDNLELRPALRRPPGPGEVEVQVSHAGLNFRDVLNALGMYPGEAGDLGAECVGTVVAVGDDVTHVRAGDPVMGMVAGSLRSHVTADARLVVRRPMSISGDAAATLPVAFLTAEYSLNHLAAMKAGDRVLIHAGAGGVGLAAIQTAQRAGAEIFATAGSPAKREFLTNLGVPHVLDSRTLAFADEIRARTNGAGVDIVLNALAGDFISASVSALAPGGRFVEIGKKDIWTAADMAALRPDVRYFPLYLGSVDPSIIQSMLERLADDIDAGRLRPLPLRTYRLTDAAVGFRFMAQAKHIGKIVFQCGESESPAVRGDATYLITGGLGTLGLVSAEWLAGRGARHLVLVGRGAPSAAAVQSIERLASQGVTVKIVSADIANRDEVSRMFAAVDAGPPLRGVVHSAGVVADGTIAHLTWEKFSSVFGAKIDGTQALDEHTRDRALDFFVLYSSAATVIPTPGQANYAAANAYLDAIARQRRAAGLPAISINWGPWADGGMAAQVDPQARAKWERLGLGMISRAQGLAVLDRAAMAPVAQVAVLPIQWRRFAAAFPGGRLPASLAHLANSTDGADAARASTPPAPVLLARLEGTPVRTRPLVVQAYVRDVVRQVLGVASSHPLELSQGLREMGMDSLMAVELRNHLQAGVGRALPSTVAFEHPTIGALASFLGALIGADAVVPQATVPDRDEDLAAAAELMELSDEDAEALLAQELEK